MKKKLLISTLLAFCLGFMPNATFAQNSNGMIDAPGDIAFVAYANQTHNGCAGFAFVLLDDCPIGGAIYFTDDEWTGTNFATVGEGEIIWTNNTISPIAKGTVIKIYGGANAFGGAVANIGNLTLTDASQMGTAAGDQLFAMTGTSRGTNNGGTLLAFVGGIAAGSLCFEGTPFGSGCVSGTPSALNFSGSKSVNITNAMGGVLYTGSTVCNGTAATCNSMINTQSSWTRPAGFTGLTSAAAFFAPIPIPNFFTGSALPVELTAFNANTEGSKNRLTWATASERGTSHFDIERSRDGKTFEKVGEVKAKGEAANYAFTDSKAVSGTSYYRLKMVDFDGTTDYSKIVSVQSYGKGKVKIYPTVTADNLVVEGAKSVTIVNMMGQVVLQREMNSSVVSLQELPKGIYIVKGEATEGGTFLEKIVKE